MTQAASKRPELARREWREFFDKLSLDYENYDVTIEVVGERLGDQIEAEKLPLSSLTYDDKDDVVIIAVGGREGRYPVVLRHMIPHPKAIFASPLTGNTPWAIDVIGEDDVQTIVTLHMRPALPAPE